MIGNRIHKRWQTRTIINLNRLPEGLEPGRITQLHQPDFSLNVQPAIAVNAEVRRILSRASPKMALTCPIAYCEIIIILVIKTRFSVNFQNEFCSNLV
jgi:hypothetical protein